MSLARRSASSSSSNGMTAATGPKTSSRATRSSFDASTSVHGNQKPGPSGHVALEGDAAVDERRDGLAVRGGDQRAHLGRLAGRVAHLHAAGRRRRGARGSGRRRSARRRCASGRSSPGRRCRRPRTGAAAAAFSRSASAKITFADLPPSSSVTRLIVAGGALHDPSPDLGRAGEADLRHVGVLDQALADDGALAGDDVHDALGDSGLEHELARAAAPRAASARPASARRCSRRRAPGRASSWRC